MTNIKGETVTLTENEKIVIDYIQGQLDCGIELIYGCDVEYSTSLSNKVARGVLASLAKRGMIDVNKRDGGLISKFWND